MTRRRTRFAIAAAAALSLFLTACGSGDGDGGGDAAGSNETKVVTDGTGAQVTVPADPQRVVTLHYAATLPTIELGVVPVGQAEIDSSLVPEQFADQLSKVPTVTKQNEPQLEQIALLKPDLIIAPSTLKEDVLGQLRQVAPVYAFPLRIKGDANQASWQKKSVMFADVLGRTEEQQKLEADYQERRKQITDTYGEQIKATKVAVISSYEDNNFYVWGNGSGVAQTLSALGFPYSPQANTAATSGGKTEAAVSFEKIGSVVSDADLLLLDSDLRGKVSSFMTSLQQTQLYKDLPVVKAGHAIPMGKSLVAGYSDANYTLDALERELKELQQQ